MTNKEKTALKEIVFEITYGHRPGMIEAILRHGKIKSKLYIKALATANDEQIKHTLSSIFEIKINETK